MTMTPARFLQIHTLSSYPATLLNRDDSGLAKRLPFGDATRTRISSQCLKRHWRKPVRDELLKSEPWSLQSIGENMATRSRQIPELRIKPELNKAGVGSAEVQAEIVNSFARLLYNPKQKTAPEVKDRQALLIGEAEIDYLTRKAIEVASVAKSPKDAATEIDTWFKRGERNNLAAMLNGRRGVLEAGLEAALFGRMVTSDPDANTDAAIHVAHAFTVHKEETESDYFTVVDDLTRAAGETGTAGLFDTELTAGLFYGYVVIDVPLLVANVGDDPPLAGKVAEHLIHLIATVSPGAKKGSTAPYAWADLLFIESDNRQPRTLANAFRSPVKAQFEAATGKLVEYIGKVDAAYGSTGERRHTSVESAAIPGSTAVPLDTLATWARDTVSAWPAKSKTAA